MDDSAETLRKKIRNGQMEKIPYMVILGDKDMENQTVSVRYRNGDDLGSMSYEAFEALLREVVDSKAKK